MLNRYPEQSHTRKIYALFGALFCAFGGFMAYIESTLGAVIWGSIGLIMLIPPLALDRERFKSFEKLLSWISIFGGL